MAELPKFGETLVPILEVLSTVESLPSRDLVTRVRDEYYSELPQDLLTKRTSTGANVLLDRIGWAKSYLKMGKFVHYPERAMVQITEKGKKTLKKTNFTLKDLKLDPDYLAHQKTVKSKNELKETSVESVESIEEQSPQDLIDSGFADIESGVKVDLLEKLKTIDPYGFERVILVLLKKMGYGDFLETPKSRDGGIDGVINEDKLGLEKIYIQAKRYNESKVHEREIRNFIGAMSGDTNKGVFVTTSSFADGAVKKAREAHHTIILIDGSKLVDLMHQYNVGVQVSSVYELKEVDEDFFDQS